MCKKCPDHPSSSLLTTAAERIKLYTGCYFFACLVFSPHGMNVFVTDFIVDYFATHVQGFSSGILTIFCKKLCVSYERILIDVWLMYMWSKEHSDTLPHSYFRSRKLWTICHCIIFQVKPTQNPASTLPYTFTQITIHNSCWEKQSFYRLLFLCLLVFPQIDINVFLTDFNVDNVVTQVAGIFKWNFDQFLSETVCEMWRNLV